MDDFKTIKGILDRRVASPKVSSEAQPQTDEWGKIILHCLRPSDTGCWILDKEKINPLKIQHSE